MSAPFRILYVAFGLAMVAVPLAMSLSGIALYMPVGLGLLSIASGAAGY